MQDTTYYCGSCRAEVRATPDKRCRQCGGLTLGPSRARFQRQEDGVTRPLDADVGFIKPPTPSRSLAETLAQLIQATEQQMRGDEKKRAILLVSINAAARTLTHLRHAYEAARNEPLGASRPPTTTSAPAVAGSNHAGASRWSGSTWGKCKNCGTTEKAHAKGGLCVDCVASLVEA